MFKPLINAVPSDFEIDGANPRPTITIPLAISEDGRQWIAVEARLWPGSWLGVDCYEFKFAIIHFDSVQGEPAVIFDRYLAEGYLSSVKHLVMPCVCSAAQTLVSVVQPEVIYRATYWTRPPEKSLSKHQMITDTLKAAGYDEAPAGTDSYGRRYWLMTKSGGVT